MYEDVVSLTDLLLDEGEHGVSEGVNRGIGGVEIGPPCADWKHIVLGPPRLPLTKVGQCTVTMRAVHHTGDVELLQDAYGLRHIDVSDIDTSSTRMAKDGGQISLGVSSAAVDAQKPHYFPSFLVEVYCLAATRYFAHYRISEW